MEVRQALHIVRFLQKLAFLVCPTTICVHDLFNEMCMMTERYLITGNLGKDFSVAEGSQALIIVPVDTYNCYSKIFVCVLYEEILTQ